MRFRVFLLALATLIALGPINTLAATTADDIRLSIDQFMKHHSKHLLTLHGNNIRIEHHINALDPRLRMADCNNPLTSNIKGNNHIGRINIKVSCKGTSPWSLYIPVSIKVYRPIVIAISPVIKGAPVEEEHVALREANISTLKGGYFTRIDKVTGLEAKRMLKPDRPILANHLQAPLIIKKGEEIYITALSGNLSVKMPAIALMDGRKGQQIRVRNRQSKRIVEAKVSGPGRVNVAM